MTGRGEWSTSPCRKCRETIDRAKSAELETRDVEKRPTP